jgi:regulator of RNase E activity RraB
VIDMAKTKAKKSGTGSGTGKKGWNRWQAKSNKVKSAKPYVSKGTKNQGNTKTVASNKNGQDNKLESINFPNDANGEALRSLQKDGVDFSKQHSVEFFVAVPNHSIGELLANELKDEGFHCFVEQDDETEEWQCCCSIKMNLDYQKIIDTQNKLDHLSKPHGGYSDGWGVFVE